MLNGIVFKELLEKLALSKLKEFIYDNRLAWRFLRFKWNYMINKWVMLPTIKNKVEYSNNIQKQVVARIKEIQARKELQASEGLSVRQAEEKIKANKRAELKAARLEQQDQERMERKISQLRNKKW
jgi:type III secretory pathway component EscV